VYVINPHNQRQPHSPRETKPIYWVPSSDWCTISHQYITFILISSFITVQWLRLNNNQYKAIILSSNKYDGSTVSSPSLKLHAVSYTDAGQYVCTATNTNGTGLSTDITVVGFTATCGISVYHHTSCELESRLWRGVHVTTL
jgi:hypothetical protein